MSLNMPHVLFCQLNYNIQLGMFLNGTRFEMKPIWWQYALVLYNTKKRILMRQGYSYVE